MELRLWDNGACLYVMGNHMGNIVTHPQLLLEETPEISNLHPEWTTLM